ncbi:SphA family protein [Xanthomonas hyacinthi]|nr:transporter [Xanthomonas hyacinthi]
MSAVLDGQSWLDKACSTFMRGLRSPARTRSGSSAARVALFGALFSTSAIIPATAAETAIPITPPAGTDLSQAILPPSGLYGALFSIPYNENRNSYDYDGNKVPAQQNVRLRIPLTGVALAYVYPFELWGGQLGSTLVVSFWDLDYSIAGGAVRGHQRNLADTYSDIFFWSKNVGRFGATPGDLPLSYGLTVAGGFALKFPTGKYDKANPLNIGSNIWLAIPNFAVTYVTGPDMSLGDSTELSARVFMGFPYKNSATGYNSGNIVAVDWSASQRFGNFQVGVAGYYQKQISDDNAAGGVAVPDGGRFSYAGIGPVLQYTFPKNGISIKAKYGNNFGEKNFTNTNFLSFSISGKLY